jgi:hypothetical protein
MQESVASAIGTECVASVASAVEHNDDEGVITLVATLRDWTRNTPFAGTARAHRLVHG